MARGQSQARPGVVVQARARRDARPGWRVGFTASKKVGGAVVRNRAKRRLREAARAVLPHYAQSGVDYVLIARMRTPDRAWSALLDDLKSALITLHQGPL